MKRIIQILIIVLSINHIKAQNLVPNGNFEDTASAFFGTKKADAWVIPNATSPDYLTSFHNVTHPTLGAPSNFSGFQEAHSDSAYMGLVIYTLFPNNASKRAREYIQGELTRVLTKDSTYCLQLFVSLADSSRFASKAKLAVHFSDNQISSNSFTFLPVNPQIIVSENKFITEKENWQQFDFQYTAQGGEKFITIGNFTDSSEVDTLFVGGGDSSNYDNIGTYYYIDDVYLGACDSLPFDTLVSIQENNLASQIKVYPNPFQNEIVVKLKETQITSLLLYDILGNQIPIQTKKQNDRLEIRLENLPSGVYFLNVFNKDQRVIVKLIKS